MYGSISEQYLDRSDFDFDFSLDLGGQKFKTDITQLFLKPGAEILYGSIYGQCLDRCDLNFDLKKYQVLIASKICNLATKFSGPR